jgi:hypothetical protein
MEIEQPRKNSEAIFASHIFGIIKEVINISDYVAIRQDE